MRRSTSELRTQFTVDGAQAVIRAAVLADVATLASVDERTDRIMQSLAGAGFQIVAKPIGKDPEEVEAQVQAERQRAEELGLTRPAGSASRVGEARRTGDWSHVSDADWTAWVNVLRRTDPAAAAEFLPTCETLARLHGLFIRADGTVTPMDKAAVEAGMIAIVERDIGPVGVKLEPGRIVEMPAGTKASPPVSDSDEDEEPEIDDWGVHPRIADGMAACHGCRVEISGIDDPHMPLTYDDDLRAYAVVTDSLTGRLVGMVECWQSEDGDFIVPRNWLVITLSAWDAQSMPKRAA